MAATAGRAAEACEFIDAALQYESSWQRAEEYGGLFGGAIGYYGSSVGAIRGTLRDAARRHPQLTHDEVTSLSSLLWDAPVYERRLAAVILLQSNLPMLVVGDLTRLEGFLRTAELREIVDSLARDVIAPLMTSLGERDRSRAESVVARWDASDAGPLRRAAEVVSSGS